MSLDVFHSRPLTCKMGISFRLERKLLSVGISTMEELKSIGSASAYERLKASGENPSVSILYAFEGAILGKHWQSLSGDQKSKIRARIID